MPPKRSGSLPEFDRERSVARLRGERFDVAVIGAGINGAAIAPDAAMRGLRVALFDQGDFAGATSSRSSKLIHGGLRYLPQGQLRLVYQALHERERLRRITAPHLVHPIRFLFPFYRGRRPGRFAVSAGLMLYDLFARMPAAQRHRRLDAAATRVLEAGLAADGLCGGALYSDATADDARLTIENVIDAAEHGAAVANYVELEGFERARSRIAAAAARDRATGERFEVRARMFVNAAGPWVDDVRRMDDPKCTPSVRLTKGVHLVFDAARMPVRNPLVLTDSAGRIVFVMPQDGYVLVGTTDTDFAGDRERVAADISDTKYLICVITGALPSIRLDEADAVYSFAGLRALVAGDGRLRPSSVPREDVILESRSGLMTVAGGKLTTHRAIAERVVGRVMRGLGLAKGECPTRATLLPGARPVSDSASSLEGLSADARNLLIGRYGTRAVKVAQIVEERPELAMPLRPDAPAIGAEVVYAVRNEMARTVADFIVRRTAMIWRAPQAAIAVAPMVAGIMGVELGWDEARKEAELKQFFNFARLGTASLRSARDASDTSGADEPAGKMPAAKSGI